MHPCGICASYGDFTPKECTYCAPCKIWKCARCMYDPVRTLNAFFKKHGGKLLGEK